MGCADVCLMMDYENDNVFHSATTRKARKSHRCCECGDPILPGDVYEYVCGKAEGEIFTVKTCAACVEIRKAFCCGSWVYEMLWESIREEMFPVWRAKGSWDCLAKLSTPEAVAKCNAEFAEWQKDWYDEDEQTTTEGGR